MVNKKIKNANPLEYNGIKFKSKLEVMVYKTLIDNNLEPEYEPIIVTLWEGYAPKVPFYDVDKKTKGLKLNNKKIISIKYSPDFYVKYGNLEIYIEAKGKENDVFYIKKKLFRKKLEDDYKDIKLKPLYFEVHTKRQLLEAIEIIKNTKQ